MEESWCRFGPSDHIRLEDIRRTGATGFVETGVGQVVSKRRSLRWTQRGVHSTLQARTCVLNGELENAFRRRWPGFRPPAKAEPAAGNGSFA